MGRPTSVLAPQDLERVRARYQARIAEHGVSLPSLKTGGEKKQRIRHAIHSTAVPSACAEVLDIGCGLGHFYQYLRDDGRDCTYCGYDIVPEYVEDCRRRYPDARHVVRNIFEEGIEGAYDTVVMCQVLNNRYRDSDNMAVMQAALTMAFDHARVSVSVDMMSSYVDYEEPELYYYSPESIFQFAKTLTPRVTLRHDYRRFEFCIQLFHESAPDFVP